MGGRLFSRVAVCAIFKDEAPYLTEWLNFHFFAGVRKFLLYDDQSSDDFMEQIRISRAAAITQVIPAMGRDQRKVYNDALKRLRWTTWWLAYLDLDEFLWSPQYPNLATALKSFRGKPAVFVQWVLFGPGPHDTKPSDGLVVPNFGWCLPLELANDDNWAERRKSINTLMPITGQAALGKSIINPRLVSKMGLHFPIRGKRDPLVVDERKVPRPPQGWNGVRSADVLRINHYWSRSREELRNKVLKGRPLGSRAKGTADDVRAWLRRAEELNQVEDWSIMHSMPAVRSSLLRTKPRNLPD